MDASHDSNTEQRNTTVWHVGGDDVYLRIPLLLRLRKLGYRVGAVGSEDGRRFAEHDIPYHYYPLKRWINPLADRKARRRLEQLFQEHRPDIVHAFDTKPAIMATLAALRSGVPGRIRTVCGMGYVFSSSSPLALALRPVYRRMQRRASDAASMTVFQNGDDRAYFRSRAMVPIGRDALVLGSGIDVDELERNRPTEAEVAAVRKEIGADGLPVVTMIARLVRHKGVYEYLEAARAVRKRHPEVRFLLIGPLASEGRQALRQSEITPYADDVQYLGRRSDVPALLAASDIFVLPTYYREGIPRVLLEAGAAGLPLIATDMPGCKDVVHHGATGLLIPPRDADALADAIGRLLDSYVRRCEFGQAAQRHVREHFEMAKVVDAYVEIYENALRIGRESA